MPPELRVVCGGLPAPRAGAAAALALDGPARNVFLNTEDVLGNFYRDVPGELLDLLEIAAYVYAADQSFDRGGPADDGGRWRRAFAFQVPVREPDLWRSADVTAALADALGFASEDAYRFAFVPAGPDLRRQRRLEWPGGGTAFDGLAEEVVLFSGGLDSLAGAAREAVSDRRKVLLVNHCPTGKGGPRFDALLDALAARAGAAAPLSVRVRVNKAESLTREYTQRTQPYSDSSSPDWGNSTVCSSPNDKVSGRTETLSARTPFGNPSNCRNTLAANACNPAAIRSFAELSSRPDNR